MHYLDEGPKDAPIVLMLHGNPTWSFYYRNIVKALRGRFRCIVPDHIGCGLSDKPDDDQYSYTLERRIADIDSLMSHISTEQVDTPDSSGSSTGTQLSNHPINLIVHDWGGMIGFGWASKRPQDIGSMVVTNTAAFAIPEQKKLPFGLWLARDTFVGAFLVRGFNAFSGLAARVAFKKPVSAEVRNQYTGPYDSWANRIATLRFVQDIPLKAGDPGFEIIESTEQRLPLFADKPCLLVWGEQDFVFDLHFLNKWKGILPNAEVLSYPDCGHYILEDGGTALTQKITEFLNQNICLDQNESGTRQA